MKVYQIVFSQHKIDTKLFEKLTLFFWQKVYYFKYMFIVFFFKDFFRSLRVENALSVWKHNIASPHVCMVPATAASALGQYMSIVVVARHLLSITLIFYVNHHLVAAAQNVQTVGTLQVSSHFFQWISGKNHELKPNWFFKCK